MYCDKKLLPVFQGECHKSIRFLVKTHFPLGRLDKNPHPLLHWTNYTRIIQLIRNPIDAVVSYQHFRRTGFNHTAKASGMEELHMTTEKLEWFVKRYRWHYEYWSWAPRRKLLVRYEDLKHSVELEMERVLRFLMTNLHESDDADVNMNDLKLALERLKCVVGDKAPVRAIPYNSSTSQNPVLYGLKWFSAEQIRYIFNELGDVMCRAGYDEYFFGLLSKRKSDGQVGDVLRQAGVYLNCTQYETMVTSSLLNATNSLLRKNGT